MTQPGINRYPIYNGAAGLRYGIGSRTFAMGRHVNHDPRSRAFAFRASTAQLKWTFHQRHIAIFDQGDLGSCTGNAGLGILATGPYWDALQPEQQQTGPSNRYPWNEDGATTLYSDVTADDDFAGQWPPTDTGSDGLSVGKELVKRGLLPGYQHTFDLASAIAALQQFPLLVGTVWTEAMFQPDTYGRIAPFGAVAGGHEWIVDEYVPPTAQSQAGPALSKTAAYVGGTTSWGAGFGQQGRFYLSAADFGRLLADDGDVMVLTPPTAPAPTPTPTPTPDPGNTVNANLAASMRAWLAANPDV